MAASTASWCLNRQRAVSKRWPLLYFLSHGRLVSQRKGEGSKEILLIVRHILPSFENRKKYMSLYYFSENWWKVEKVVEVRSFTVHLWLINTRWVRYATFRLCLKRLVVFFSMILFACRPPSRRCNPRPPAWSPAWGCGRPLAQPRPGRPPPLCPGGRCPHCERPHCKELLPKVRNKYSQKRIARPQDVSVSDLYIPTIDLPILIFCCGKYADRSWDYIDRPQTPEKEYRT